MFEVSVSDIFKEDFSMCLYCECEDGHLDDTPQEAADCNNGLDHQEEEEESEWDVSSCSLNSEFSCQEDFISLEFIRDIAYEMHEKNQVLNYGISNEIVDISCTSC